MSRLELEAGIKIKRGPYALLIKRLLDILFSFIGIVLFSPIWIILALLVKMKLGSPIFFTQIRIGKDEKPFRMIKFRTMADLRDERGELLSDAERFTKFGDFLRNTSLDEVTELMNVFIGQMSFVGPRPLYTFYLPYYNHKEALRHAVRGGITGLAQINGRNTSDWEKRFSYDVEYVENITFLNDLKIVIKTVFKVLKREDVGVPNRDEPESLNIVREIQRPENMKEIGSSFSISKKQIGRDLTITPFINKEEYKVERWYSTGRSCIREILKANQDERKIALVPPFTCQSVTDPFFESKYLVYTYPIKKDFTIDYNAFCNKLIELKPSVLIFHSYFGFDNCSGLKKLVSEIVDWKMWTINDETHSMFAKMDNSWTDFRIGSVRKWGPIPDGAYLLAKEGDFIKTNKVDETFVKGEIEALTEKQNYLDGKNVSKEIFLQQFEKGRKYIDAQNTTYSISDESKSIINKIDWDKCNEVRRENYKVLLNGLRDYEWISLPISYVTDNDAPYEMPIYVYRKRKDFQMFLAKNRVYATIIWNCPDDLIDKITEKEKFIYNAILCLPCDHRYSKDDMKRILLLFKEYDKLRNDE